MEGLGVIARMAVESTRRRVTRDTELVAIGVSKVGAIVVLMVLRPQTRRTFRCATVGESDAECLIYGSSALCEKGDHVAVTRLRRELVIRLANKEERSWAWSGLPTSPRTASLAEARLDAK